LRPFCFASGGVILSGLFAAKGEGLWTPALRRCCQRVA